MSYAQCPRKAGLPREVVKWLQSLELSVYPKNVRRDLSSGYLVAEIFSHYYPQDFPEHSYDKGTSLSAKQKNWSRIQRFLQKQNLHLRKDVIDGAIHCKPGAAELLVQDVYTILTNKSIAAEVRGSDFTDQEYQELLPPLARSTASTAIKSNLRKTEIMAKADINTNQRKADVILHRHLEHRAAERALNPAGRFKVKPNLGQLATERLSPSSQPDDERSDSPSSTATTSKLCSSSTWNGAAVSFKEMKVHQPISNSRVNY